MTEWWWKVVVGWATRGIWWGNGWRHGMPWYRLPACNGRESVDDLRASTRVASSGGATNLTRFTGGHYAPTIGWVHGTTRIRRRFKYGFFFSATKSRRQCRINQDWFSKGITRTSSRETRCPFQPCICFRR